MNIEKIYGLCEKIQKTLRDGLVHADVYPYSASLPVIDVEINWGDWKHDHARAKWLIGEMGEDVHYLNSVVTEEDGSDCYSAVHRFYVSDCY